MKINLFCLATKTHYGRNKKKICEFCFCMKVPTVHIHKYATTVNHINC